MVADAEGTPGMCINGVPDIASAVHREILIT